MMQENIKGCITAIQRYCLDDGPGIRTTVFLKGCPLLCKWCHNPETWHRTPECMQRSNRCTGCGKCVSACPTHARQLTENAHMEIDRTLCSGCGKCAAVCPTNAAELCGYETDTAAVLSEVERDKLFYKSSGGGMTVSGGECAMQPEFTLSLLREAKKRGIHTALETCGLGDPAFFSEAAALQTLFLFDLKCMDPARHKAFTGVSNTEILQNLEMLMSQKAEIILRLPLIPGVNDTDEDLSALCAFLQTHRGKYRSVQIMPYHDLGTSKSEALGRTPFTVDDALCADRCAACKPRWLQFFTENEIPVETE